MGRLCSYFFAREGSVGGAIGAEASATNGERMRLWALLFGFLIFACCPARAQPDEELSGCVDRQRAQKYLADHNYAELLRGEGANGKTVAVWTTGVKIIVLNFQTPKVPGSDEVKTICVDASASKVAFGLEVIEKLIGSAAGAAKH
jgi:hypothetical protein